MPLNYAKKNNVLSEITGSTPLRIQIKWCLSTGTDHKVALSSIVQKNKITVLLVTEATTIRSLPKDSKGALLPKKYIASILYDKGHGGNNLIICKGWSVGSFSLFSHQSFNDVVFSQKRYNEQYQRAKLS